MISPILVAQVSFGLEKDVLGQSILCQVLLIHPPLNHHPSLFLSFLSQHHEIYVM